MHFTAGPEASRAGLVERLVALGDAVTKGQRVALLHPTAGARGGSDVILSPMPGYALRQTEHAFATPNQLIGKVGTPMQR
ncbi:hypothetical protein AB4Z40_31270 [Bosea sp. 2YAB26]|uniref:hypothetical protein n=1 Tax=Bosea sp. 2YAB26 TaxID=3237478 RepID=UPI003F91511C